MTLTPAYGRDYKSAKAAIAAFVSGQDFIANTPWRSGAFNINEMARGTSVQIRYSRLIRVTTFTKT